MEVSYLPLSFAFEAFDLLFFSIAVAVPSVKPSLNPSKPPLATFRISLNGFVVFSLTFDKPSEASPDNPRSRA